MHNKRTVAAYRRTVERLEVFSVDARSSGVGRLHVLQFSSRRDHRENVTSHSEDWRQRQAIPEVGEENIETLWYLLYWLWHFPGVINVIPSMSLPLYHHSALLQRICSETRNTQSIDNRYQLQPLERGAHAGILIVEGLGILPLEPDADGSASDAVHGLRLGG